jgi:hypothetical protein
MNKMPVYAIKKIVFFAIFAAFFNFLPLAQCEIYKNQAYGFTLNIPDTFEVAKIEESPGLALALKSKALAASSKHFPTITVTLHPGPLKHRSGWIKDSDAILESYHKVGLLDAKYEGDLKLNLYSSLFENKITKITFTRASEPFTALVALLEAQDHHYIITYLIPSSEMKDPATIPPALSQVISSFQTGDLPKRAVKKRYPIRDRIFTLISSLAVLAVLWFLFKLANKKAKNRAY